MKIFRFSLIIGFTLCILALPQDTQAYNCHSEGNWNSIYRDAYCDMVTIRTPEGDETEWVNEDLFYMVEGDINDPVYEAVAEQMGFTEYFGLGDSEELVKQILDLDLDYSVIQEGVSKGITQKDILEFMKKNKVDQDGLPDEVKDAFFGPNPSQDLDYLISRVSNAYEQEKVLYRMKRNLKREFTASEKYWDGQIREIGDAPFDLIVDLNLIEMILFGSEAVWISDVWSFPSDDDEDGEDEDAEDEGVSDGKDEGEDADDKDEDDEGVAIDVTEIEGEEGEGDCLPPDHPDADVPGPDDDPVQFVNCGNGILDVLLGEQCDDGNQDSGDGCSQYCLLEETGADAICEDPEAVTFKMPDASDLAGEVPSDDSPSIPDSEGQGGSGSCPPGTYPRRDRAITGPEAEGPPEYPQSPQYPGPNVGGTLKQFPPGKRPACPGGYSELKASSDYEGAGEDGHGQVGVSAEGSETLGIKVAGKTYEIPKCIPTKLCASFDDVRNFVWGDDWSDDPETEQLAMAIEALFCVEVKKENRPTSPYPLSDGCIDCHLQHIVDTLEKILSKNVAPLENTMTGFAISGHWSPNFTFNLSTMIKSHVRMVGKVPGYLVDHAGEYISKKITGAKTENITPNIPLPQSAQQDINDISQKRQQEVEKILSNLENYREGNKSLSDLEFNRRVIPLLGQMHGSFQRLNTTYGAMADLNFSKKDMCKW